MDIYEKQVRFELEIWQKAMIKDPSFADILSKKIQTRINNVIPDKVHHAITVTIQKMVQVVLFGSTYTSSKPLESASLQYREAFVKRQIEIYKKTASAEGAVTGAGGILLGLADFPLLLGIKIKLLFEIAALYGYNAADYRERLYLLYVFQLAFSSRKRQKEVFSYVSEWDAYLEKLPANVQDFDWRTFQQEYRDYIDLAKMAQLIPVIGAAVGAIANYRLIDKLGITAMNCYRIREFSKDDPRKLA
ncbi:EcsC family protein [Paradesertivirga mongoliensis]|uniref:EcsC family protein n=1 Tax=Paradesertivirga mongoliensis TaxID=2100740 RepID=A0ABW4ZNP4_9SPHI|nr:EcsC family protein [Pedobacter mongoliensis]